MIEIVANHGRGDYIQKYNAVDKLDKNAKEKILNMFQSLATYRITSIIRLKSHAEKNSTYVQVSQTESTYKDRRWTRNCRSSTSAHTIVPILSKLNRKAPCRRGMRGSGKKEKEAVKVNSGVVEGKGISYFIKISVFLLHNYVIL